MNTRYIDQDRARIEYARKLLTDALEAISGPNPDTVLADVLTDMAIEILSGTLWG